MKKVYAIPAIILIVLATAPLAHSQEWRRIEPIATPSAPLAPITDEGIIPAEQIPVDRRAVEQAMQAVARSWNSADMSGILSESFRNKDRLMDVMATAVPADATMRLVSVGSHRILNQVVQPRPEGTLLVSRVVVSARVQVEYNDPATGFQRLPGEQDYIIKITQQWEAP